MENKKNRRRFFRNNSLQAREILGCFLLIGGGGLLFTVLLGHLLTPSWYLSLCGGMLIIAGSFLLSHKITGPMFRFESILDHMQQGHLDKTIHLREKDAGQELAQKINAFNSQLSRSLHAIGQNSRALDILIEQVATLDLPEGEKERLASLCWSMQEHNRKISNNCNYYSPTPQDSAPTAWH
ncbi:methyl-accepting chemotaxis protein [Desulfopila sp. IMCC35006]|uniref:methyl-accepting chemotaxis protein n=1 Tax=Desulfopila sp. IMCC35006 TaxID=2569542 RepID=UPI0010AB9A58|nr:methyl-accepting chemotaxis protein [Desulfopila sp. IMCC35006]TKB23226.1 methyl-accepting chemotaxis protein [Desulfopila sp. IMCC35006]